MVRLAHPQTTALAAQRRELAFAVAVLSVAAALIHLSVMVVHFQEYWLFGLFFALIAPLQLLFAYLITRPAVTRELLWIGLVGNFVVPLVWLVSRTSGLPIGPDAGQAEAVHLPDVVATLDELAIAALLTVMLRAPGESRLAPPWVLPSAWTLGCISLIAATAFRH